MNLRHAGFLTTVISLHVLVLWALQGGLALRAVDHLPQASLVVQLLAPQVQSPVPRPVAEIPPPLPVVKPRPRSKPRPPPKPLEHAVTEPEPPEIPAEPEPVEEEPAVTAADPSPPTATAPVAPPSEPVAPPRFDAAYLSNPAPAYPPLSKRLGEQGRVDLRVYVRDDGSAARIEIQTSSGHSRLDQAALDAVTRWKFVPAMRGTEKVAAWVVVPISFGLTD